MATTAQPLNSAWWHWPFRRATVAPPALIPVPSPQPIVPPTPADLLRMAVVQNADLDKLTKLMDLQERWEKNQARKAFVAAITAFKNNPPAILKNATASFQTKKGDTVRWDYASLDHICDAVIAGLSDHGISHDWSFEQVASDTIRVTCVLTHDLGHERRTTLQGPPDFSGDKSPIHAIYSTVTHLERYTLLGAVGLAAGDPEQEPMVPQEMSAGNRTRENCALMANAENLDQLQAIFRAAYAEASAENDQKAQLAYIKAKDARRRELR
jgi:ERF superfamily